MNSGGKKEPTSFITVQSLILSSIIPALELSIKCLLEVQNIYSFAPAENLNSFESMIKEWDGRNCK